MRITKALLLQHIVMVENFNRLPFQLVTPQQEIQLHQRHGFISVERYGTAYLPQRGEVGTDFEYRYKTDTRRKGGTTMKKGMPTKMPKKMPMPMKKGKC